MEIGRYTVRQSILCWKVVKMWVRIGATYLLFTALTEKNVRIDTAQHQEIFLMTDISSCRPILTPIALTDLDLLIFVFWNHQVPPNLLKILTSDNQGQTILLANIILQHFGARITSYTSLASRDWCSARPRVDWTTHISSLPQVKFRWQEEFPRCCRAAIAAEMGVLFDKLFVGNGVRHMYPLCCATIHRIFGSLNFSGKGNFQDGG